MRENLFRLLAFPTPPSSGFGLLVAMPHVGQNRGIFLPHPTRCTARSLRGIRYFWVLLMWPLTTGSLPVLWTRGILSVVLGWNPPISSSCIVRGVFRHCPRSL